MNFGKKLAVIVTVFLALCTGASGTDTSGKILGTVKDQTENLIPRAGVTLTNKATGVKQTTCSLPPMNPNAINRVSVYGKRTSSQNIAVSQSNSSTRWNGKPRSRAFFSLLAGSNSIFTIYL